MNILFTLLACVFLGLGTIANADPTAPPLAYSIRLADSINPGSGAFLIEAIDQAERDHAAYLLIELDTPGGLLSTTRNIVSRMLNTPVPIVIWVGPSGARAGSAGALMTFASDVALMAPNTNIGAAHPVQTGDAKSGDTLSEKITNDTAAFAEGLAKSHGRNATWAIDSVRKSASITAEEALKLGVVEKIVEKREQLPEVLKGFALRRPKGAIAKLPEGVATIKVLPMSTRHRAVSFFSNPEIAYLLMSLGGICLWVELANPGLLLPGIVGVLCLLISLISFEAMPIHHGALALIASAFVMFIAEVFVASHGVLGVGGAVAFLVGSLFLMDTEAPLYQISLSIILPTVATMIGMTVALSLLALRARRLPVQSGLPALIGMRGVVREAVTAERGLILVEGELWKAKSSGASVLPVGSHVIVVAALGLELTVREEEKTS